MHAKVGKLPGKKSKFYLDKIKALNLGWNEPYPFVHSEKGQGCYFQDIDGNVFLDFASQIASNPLGYNHPDLLEVVKKYSKRHPVKFAGQDFTVKEHVELLEELVKITPQGLDKAFLINSGAEAVENAIKVALRYKKTAKYAVSFEFGWHGRTLGALSCTNSKAVQKNNFFSLPVKRIPFSTEALNKLERLILSEGDIDNIGFVIMEVVQGEGGYNIAPERMIKEIRAVTREKYIPLIIDEVQSGLGRTGKWFACEHFGVKPDILTASKALQVGATISSKKFDLEPGSISSTWGGGHILDLAIGLETIRIIKRDKLLEKNKEHGDYLKKRLKELEHENNSITRVRGLGLMVAFDLPTKELRDSAVLEFLKSGLVTVGCGISGVRLIPPYVVTKKEIDQAMDIIEKSLKSCCKVNFKQEGEICKYINCGETSS